jgi:ABC-type microcin C transport system permease subunit YejE
VKTVLGTLCWPDQPLFHLAQVFGEISFQVGVLVLDSARSAQDMFGCLDGYMALVIVARANDWDVENLEFLKEAMLMGQNGDPRFSP